MKTVRHTYFVSILGSALLAVMLLTGCNNTDSDSDTISFRSGDIDADEAYAVTFDEEGRVDYYCEVHQPDMKGVITVSNTAEMSDEVYIEMQNLLFNPANITITANTTVIWSNEDDVIHRVRSGTPTGGDDNGGNGGDPY